MMEIKEVKELLKELRDTVVVKLVKMGFGPDTHIEEVRFDGFFVELDEHLDSGLADKAGLKWEFGADPSLVVPVPIPVLVRDEWDPYIEPHEKEQRPEVVAVLDVIRKTFPNACLMSTVFVGDDEKYGVELYNYCGTPSMKLHIFVPYEDIAEVMDKEED